jgi:hypothetical protein
MIKSSLLWFYPNPWSNEWKLLCSVCWIQQNTLQLSGLESRHLSKIQNGRHTIASQKNKQKNFCFKCYDFLTLRDEYQNYLKIEIHFRSHIYANYVLSGYNPIPMRALYIHSSTLRYLLLCYIQNRHRVRSFLFICGGHSTKICGGSQIYIIFSLVYFLARGCLPSAYSIENRRWLLGFRVFSLFVAVTKPKSAVGHKSILSSLWFTSGLRVSTVCLQYTEQVLATGVPSFLFSCGGHETKIFGGSQIYIVFSLVYWFWPEGVYCLLTVYRTGVGYWGSEFLI